MNNYSRTSPYYTTPIIDDVMEPMANRNIPALSDDVLWSVTAVYEFRPTLLAYDLYGDAALWWVFANRNPNRLNDPIFDFKVGTPIYLPKIETLQTVLGF